MERIHYAFHARNSLYRGEYGTAWMLCFHELLGVALNNFV